MSSRIYVALDTPDLARAKAELASAQSEALGIDRRRATTEHALAVLLGRAPSDFTMPLMYSACVNSSTWIASQRRRSSGRRNASRLAAGVALVAAPGGAATAPSTAPARPASPPEPRA